MFGAMVTGLGSILGTGAFVSIGLAASRWGDAVLLAIPLAGLLAIFNGLSSARLAGMFPVAGGTYEYAYQSLNPTLGFTAGWLFLLAKTASAASAALGVTLYLGLDGMWAPLATVAILTVLILTGLRRTTVVNTVLVSITIAAIVWFAVEGMADNGGSIWEGLSGATGAASGIPAAIAFLFVAYTGYGRIATLGEEVHDPVKTIPRAVIATLAVAVLLYMAIELGGRARAGEFWGSQLTIGFLDSRFLVFGAVTAMAGVLLNLILGLSRVWLAMGRRGDMPSGLGRLDSRSQPVVAVAVTGAIIAATTLVGDIGLAWSFSAMTVLLYYGITNLAALATNRRMVTAWIGLVSCAGLSFFVPLRVWVVGAGLVIVGLAWKTLITRGPELPSAAL
jgi:APA family basic amino acid/polyamine antiporter